MIYTVLLTLLAFLGIISRDASPTTRIWNGTIVPIEEMPWMVQYEDQGLGICGGVILSADYMLTSATCTSGSINQYRIRAGTDRFREGGSLHHLVSLFNHPDYDVLEWQYDLAVGKVSPPFALDSTRQPIRLGSKNPEIGSMGSVSGWGKTFNGSFWSEVLLTQSVTIISPDDICEPHEDLQFCGSGAFCGRDWGDPFVQDGVVLGLASLQHFCHDTNTYVSVISKVNREFIMEATGLEYN